jgi:predicted nucleotidyltransferase
MLQQSEILKFLKQEKPFLQREFNVDSIGLFGSYARSTQTQTSDIDILVRFSKPDFMLWSGLLNYLQKSLNHKVDLVTESNRANPHFTKLIENEIIYA